ncbi:hypothetical protein [Psychroserpens sp.]|uniref:DUF7507 domain-containing protein n=1 Tax=Psychroserpens sp. TaxID=2020870 RepID=UPI00385B22A5
MRLLLSFLFASLLLASCSSSDSSDDTPMNPVNANLRVSVTATIVDNGNGITGIDDVVEYTISVHNTGEATLSSISLVSSLKDFLNNSLNLDAAPTFISATSGSEMGSILADEIATYRASFTITQNEVNADGFSYSVTVNALTPDNTNISDVSDNGDDSDGNLDNDLTEISIQFDPLIIKEYHILNSNGNPSTKYFFNDDGRFKEMHTQNTKYHFDFDSSEKLVNITTTDMNDVLIESQDVVYTSENRIESIGSRNFDFYEDDNYYIDTSTYSPDGPFYYEDNGVQYEEYEVYYHKYEVSNTNPIIKLCLYSGIERTNLNTNEVEEIGDCSEFESNYFTNNVTNECGDTDCVNFGYDNNSNPLLGSTNLIEVYGLIRIFGTQPSNLNILINANNLTVVNYSDPSYISYDYEFNSNDLPVTGSRQYIDELGPDDINPYSRYYYQGDVVPD